MTMEPKHMQQKATKRCHSPSQQHRTSFARITLPLLFRHKIPSIMSLLVSVVVAFQLISMARCAFYQSCPLSDERIISSSSSASALHERRDTAATVSSAPRSVYLWPFDTQGPRNTEIMQLVQNGIEESPYLSLTTHDGMFDSNVIWIGDAGEGYWYGWYPWIRNHICRYLMRIGLLNLHHLHKNKNIGYDRTFWCQRFLQQIQHAKKERYRRGLSLSWPIFIVDLTDYSVLLRCPEIEREMGSDWVVYGTRSIVQGRHFSTHQHWTRSGQTIHLPPSFQHMPLIVRTDTVQTLQDLLVHQYNMTLAAPIERFERDTDVSHFWPMNKQGLYQSYTQLKGSRSKLRGLVSHVITEMGEQHPVMSVFVGLVGAKGKQGRYNVVADYIDALLNTKITVVTQPDRWEDHYRLYEALVTGGMVITDRMLSLPHGLENGTSIIECTSREELQSQILYYLSHPEERIEIARQGRYVAMSQHRSWHRMEELIFGRIMTNNCSNDDDDSVEEGDNTCPFVLHAR